MVYPEERTSLTRLSPLLRSAVSIFCSHVPISDIEIRVAHPSWIDCMTPFACTFLSEFAIFNTGRVGLALEG